MQGVVPRCRNVLIFKSSIVLQSSATAAALSSSSSSCSSSTHLAWFHSTPVSSEKWKSKWNSDFRRPQQQSKYIRYATRQKRADTKRALKQFLFNGGYAKITLQRFFPEFNGITNQNTEQEDHSGSSDTKSRSKSSTHRTSRAQYKRMKRKRRQECGDDDPDDYPETVFQSIFGGRWYNWSFNHWKEFYSQYSKEGFDWGDQSNWTSSRRREWRRNSDIESDDETCGIGSLSERKMLGLPPTGPLTLGDVKKAFHLSALKWHPDKHQGSSQAMAGEKFKLCVDAYKSLCNTFT